jgi:hypothetical protein
MYHDYATRRQTVNCYAGGTTIQQLQLDNAMKRLAIALLFLAAASWGNAQTTLWSAGFEDGEINPGGPDSATGNTTPYPAAQPASILDGTYGWASKPYNLTDSRSFSTIVDSQSFLGANSALVMNRNFRTDISFTIAANSLYTFTMHYLVDATTDFDNNSQIQQRMLFRDISNGSLILADNHPEAQTTGVPVNPTTVTYGQWQTASLTWDSTGYSGVGQLHRLRLITQFSDAWNGAVGPHQYDGGAYLDGMSFTVEPVPEPASWSLLGLGLLPLLLRRRAAAR